MSCHPSSSFCETFNKSHYLNGQSRFHVENTILMWIERSWTLSIFSINQALIGARWNLNSWPHNEHKRLFKQSRSKWNVSFALWKFPKMTVYFGWKDIPRSKEMRSLLINLFFPSYCQHCHFQCQNKDLWVNEWVCNACMSHSQIQSHWKQLTIFKNWKKTEILLAKRKKFYIKVLFTLAFCRFWGEPGTNIFEWEILKLEIQ